MSTPRIVRCEHCGRQNRVQPAGPGYPRCGNCGSPLPWMVDAGDADFAEVAEQATIFVLVDLWAPWCGPCRMVSPALEQVARDRAGRLKLVKVNVDEAPRLSQRFDLRAVPTLLMLHRGEVIARQPGAAPAHVLGEWVDTAIAKTKTSISDLREGSP
ncbi:MAG TPA: thioredoxin [Actinophytocola sp.]|uniref:thioredoxin n=1 Tax=Actinophytocola sp. TaxID=1872138 RepID=UPI002DB93CC8|nr:thioredoxin [Actinophytocola sp.]HEU5474023.1 thioredoxin [Actinophytocola sp.]